MKGTNYVIGLFVYIASILLPVIVSSKAISYTHIALYAVFSLIIIAGATIDMHYYILPDEGALVLVIGGIIYSYINDQSMFVTFCVGSLYLLLAGYRNRYIPFGPFLCFDGWCALHGGSYMEVLYQWLRCNL